MNFPKKKAEQLIELAIKEDIGSGDLTSILSFPEGYNPVVKARLISKDTGILAGLPILELVLKKLAPNVQYEQFMAEGDAVVPKDLIVEMEGPVRELLTAERIILNFLQRLSGVATLAHRYACAAAPAKILDTRKTLPGWRELDKYAVKIGGAENHRMGLYDMVLIKDNHIAAAGGVPQVLTKVLSELPAGIKVEIEVENMDMLVQALAFPIHRIMLDNMDLAKMKTCVQVVRSMNPQVEIEASGNMTLERLAAVAETGVDFISVGAITHSVPVFDISMRLA